MGSRTLDEYFLWGGQTSASQRAHWWIIITHHAGAPLNMDGGKQSQKTSSLLCQAYHMTWCTNIYPKNNQPYLGTFRNLEKASDQHKKIYSSQNQIQNKTNFHHPSSQTTPIFLPQDSGYNRKILHGPNRKVTSYIQQGQQLYTGSIPL